MTFFSVAHVAQSVAYLSADPGVASSIPALSHTFMEIDHEIIVTIILKRKYVHEGSDFATCASCIVIKNSVLDS